MKRPQPSSSFSPSFYMKEFARSFLRQKKFDDILSGKDDEMIQLPDKEEIAFPFNKIELPKSTNQQTSTPKSPQHQQYKQQQPMAQTSNVFDRNIKPRQQIFRSKKEYQYYLYKTQAMDAVSDMIEHLRIDDEEKRVIYYFEFI